MKKIAKVVLCIVLGFIVVFVLFFFGLFVTNKILSQREISTIQDFGEKLTLNDKKINVSLSGDKKNKTIILLPGFATPSPVIDFNELIDELSNDFYVVTIEPFGYGLSDDTTTERTLENINQEIHAVIKTLNLHDYVLMGHSISGIYTLDYMNRYSDEVSTFIGIDSSVPNQSGVEDDMGEALSILKNSGVYRLITKVNPSILNYPNVSQSEKIEFRKLALKNLSNQSILSESSNMAKNFDDVSQMKYSSNNSVLFILASESVADTSEGNWLELHEQLLEGTKKGEIEVLNGAHYLHHTKAKKIVELTRQFIK